MKRARAKNKKNEKKKLNMNGLEKNTKKKVKSKKRKKIFLTVLILAVVLIFVLLGLGGSDNSLIPIDNSTGKMNVLLLGVDEDGLRTDAIMIASYDFDNESLKLLSIPRDTKMYVTNRKLTRKINEIHAMTKEKGEIMGPLASVEAVTALTGIPINYYLEFNFAAIDEIADILGPVEFDVPDIEGNGQGMNYDDPVQDLHIHLKPGLQQISGNQYQQFLRYRKSNNEKVDGSDLSRVKRQHEFVKAIIDQKVDLSLIVKIPDIYAKVKKNIKTNFSVQELWKYSGHLLTLASDTENKMVTYSLPGEDKHSTAWYFECDFDETRTLIETEFGYDASNITNKVEITGEKKNTSKNSSIQTEEPLKTEKSDISSETKEKATQKPEATEKVTQTETPSKTEKPKESEAPQKTAAPEVTKTPEKTKEPEKTIEPYRPTAKPSKDNDVLVIED